MNAPDCQGPDKAIKFHPHETDIWVRQIPGDWVGFLRHEMETSGSHALSFEFLAPVVSRVWHKMKVSGLPLCLFPAVFSLFWTPSAGLKMLHLGNCVITTNLQEMQHGFSEIRDSVVCD